MNDEVYFWHADRCRSFLQVNAIILGVAKVPKTRIIYISLQYLQENIGDKVDFLPVKDKSPLQVDTIFLSIHSQACPKYPKQHVCNIFAIF